jgi:hypothetical protein
MTSHGKDIAFSELSGCITRDDITVNVQIYRLKPNPEWALVVISGDGICTIWDQLFESEDEAFAAFEVAAQDEGMASFLDDGESTTLH